MATIPITLEGVSTGPKSGTVDINTAPTVETVLSKAEGIEIRSGGVYVRDNYSSLLNSELLESKYKDEHPGEDFDPASESFKNWCSDREKDAEKGAGAESPFNSTYWEVSPGLGEPVTKTTTITLTLHL